MRSLPQVSDWRFATSEHSRLALLACGVASSLLYGAMITTIGFAGYDPWSQVPSELTAIGTPTRSLWMILGALYTALVLAFGFGIWISSAGNRRLRVIAWSVLAYGALGFLWPFAPMHQREVLASGGGSVGDTLHVALGAVTVCLMFAAVGTGATVFGWRFRVYSVLSTLALVFFGTLTFLGAPRLQADLPTPWLGLWERLAIAFFLLWVAVIAVRLSLRHDRT